MDFQSMIDIFLLKSGRLEICFYLGFDMAYGTCRTADNLTVSLSRRDKIAVDVLVAL
jgi:hypothetical protein